MDIYVDCRGADVIEDPVIRGVLADKGDDHFTVDGDVVRKGGVQVGRILEIQSPEDMSNAMEDVAPDEVTHLFIKTGEWTIIPLENLIAKYAGMGVSLVAFANSVHDLKTLSEVLEVGVDGAVVDAQVFAEHRDEIMALSGALKFQLTPLEIVSTETTGTGERVCVDTTARLKPGEGLLVGSSAKVLVLVEAEVANSGYVAPRPFRVNAGPVSSYVLNGERTNYLSELHAGKEVLVVNRDGQTRKELVGRVKIERRPFIKIGIQFQEREYPVLLQNAETVRLVTPDGSVSVTDVKVGDVVLCKVDDIGRHFGMEVEEFIDER